MRLWYSYIAISILRSSEQAMLNLMSEGAVLRRQIARTRCSRFSQECSDSCHDPFCAQLSNSGELGKVFSPDKSMMEQDSRLPNVIRKVRPEPGCVV